MSSNPINLTVRFLLELAGLAAMGYWGWVRGEGLVRPLLVIGVPLVAATLWGVFRVPGDPGPAPVAVHGVGTTDTECQIIMERCSSVLRRRKVSTLGVLYK